MARSLTHQASIQAILILAGGLLAASPAAAGDAGYGRAVFAAKCAVCHTAYPGGPAVLGPNLFGVVGRKAGSGGGFSYSPAMKSARFTWSNHRLWAYLAAPGKVVPGTRMTYVSLKNHSQRNDLIAYLNTLK